MGGPHIGRRFAVNDIMVERRMHVGQRRMLRLQSADPIQRFGKRKMAGMRLLFQGVDDQPFEPRQTFGGLFAKAGNIGTIGKIADAEAE